MPSNDLWTQIPDSLLNADDALTKAEDWASQQRAKLAETWAQAQKNALNVLQAQWQQKAGSIAAPAMTQDDLGKYAPGTSTDPLPVKTFPDTTATDAADATNPADVLNQSRDASAARPHLEPGTPENAFHEAMREGASHAGVYLPPQPGAVADPNKEAALQAQAAQGKRPLLGEGGLTLPNVENTITNAAQGASTLARGELAREASGPLVSPTELAARGALAATDAYGGAVQQNLDRQSQIAAMPEGPAKKEALYQASEAAVMGVTGNEDIAAEQIAKPVLKAAGQTPILGGVFYSNAERIINEKLPAKATGQQILNTLINSGAKPAELAWTGLKDFLGDKAGAVIPKSDVQEFIRDNMVQVQEVVKKDASLEDSYPLEAYYTHAGALGHDINATQAFLDNIREGNEHLVPPELLPEARAALNDMRTVSDKEARYSGTVLAGGSNYRELLLTLPPKEVPLGSSLSREEGTRLNELQQKSDAYVNNNVGEPLTLQEQRELRNLTTRNYADSTKRNERYGQENFISNHWDEPNILAHVRYDERTGPDGKPMLFLNEVQSDWAQQGRKKGFQQKELPAGSSVEELSSSGEKEESGYYVKGPDGKPVGGSFATTREQALRLGMEAINQGKTASMPFQRTEDWVKLAAKRMVAWAAEHGQARIGWTTGVQQDKIEGLGTRFNRVEYNPQSQLLHLQGAYGNDSFSQRDVAPEALPGIVGQELSQRLLATVPNQSGAHALFGDSLNVPTKGMAEFYDKILPSVFRDLGKQFGAKVEDISTVTTAPDVFKISHGPDPDQWAVYNTRTGNTVGPDFKTQAEAEAHRDQMASPQGRPRFVIVQEGDARFGTFHDTYSIFDRSTGKDVETNLPNDVADQKLLLLNANGKQETIHSITIPPQMAEVARKGQALFSPPAVGGGIAGAAYGSQQGDTPQEREQNALKYGIGGALAGHFLGGGGLPFGMSIKPTYTDPELQRVSEMLSSDIPEATYLASQGFIDKAYRDFQRAWTDNGIDLTKLQDSITQHLGRPPTANEMLAELRRLNPDAAAETNLYKNLAPAIRSVAGDPNTLDGLDQYLMYRHNIEVANSSGEKVAQKVLGKPLKSLPATAQLATLQARLRAYQRFLAAGHAANDGTVNMHYTPLVAKTQTLVASAQTRLAAQVGAAQVDRAIAAYLAGKVASGARKFSGALDLDSSIDNLTRLENDLGPVRFQQVQDAARQVVTFGRGLLQRKVDAGIITQDYADHLNALYPEYVPIRILDHMIEPVSNTAGGGRSLSMTNKGIKELSLGGTEKNQERPLAAMVRLAYSTEAAARKNETFNALHNLVQADPAFAQSAHGIQQVSSIVSSSRVAKNIQGFVKGVPTIYAMPRDLAEAVEHQPQAGNSWIQQAMSFLRGIMASSNPLFIPVHAAITAIPYAMRTATREGGPQALPRVIGALGSAYMDAFKGLGTGRYGADTERYLQAGGGMFAHVFDYSPGAARASLEDLSRANPFQVRSAADARRIAGDIIRGRPVSEFINRVDLAPRVAAFRRAEKRGANLTQAVTEGRTATIDFAMGGEFAKQINQLVPFFNVAVQGSLAPMRALKNNPKAFIGTAIATLAAPTAAIEAWNRADPQRARDYNDVPNYYKDSGLVIMAPVPPEVDAAGNRRPYFAYIPTREFSPFVVATRELVGRTLGAEPRSWQSLLYGNDFLKPSGGLVSGMSPVADVGRLIPGGALGNIGIGAVTGVNPITGSKIASQAANARSGSVAQGAAGLVRSAQAAMGGMPTAQSSEAQYVLNELGGPGRIVGAIGQPAGGPSLIPLAKNSTGQDLQDARGARLSEPLRQFLLDADLPEVAPAAQVVSKIPLTQQEETELQTMLNGAYEQVAAQVMKDPRWQSVPPDVKKQYAQKVLAKVRAVIGAKFIQTLESRQGSDALRQRIKNAPALKKAS